MKKFAIENVNSKHRKIDRKKVLIKIGEIQNRLQHVHDVVQSSGQKFLALEN